MKGSTQSFVVSGVAFVIGVAIVCAVNPALLAAAIFFLAARLCLDEGREEYQKEKQDRIAEKLNTP